MRVKYCEQRHSLAAHRSEDRPPVIFTAFDSRVHSAASHENTKAPAVVRGDFNATAHVETPTRSRT